MLLRLVDLGTVHVEKRFRKFRTRARLPSLHPSDPLWAARRHPPVTREAPHGGKPGGAIYMMSLGRQGSNLQPPG